MLRGIATAASRISSRLSHRTNAPHWHTRNVLSHHRTSPPPPDVVRLAEFLAVRFEAETLIEIPLGPVFGLRRLAPARMVRADLTTPIGHVRGANPMQGWLSGDRKAGLDLDPATLDRSIVIASSTSQSGPLAASALERLAKLSHRARAVLVTVPASAYAVKAHRNRRPADGHRGCARSVENFEHSLRRHGLVPTFVGLVSTSEEYGAKETLLAILDHCRVEHGQSMPDEFRPLALVATYNDADIASQTISKLLDDSFDVHVLDNWSTDGTYQQLAALAARTGGLILERFPEDGPTQYHEWHRLLTRKEEIAERHSGRWIIHHDSDEIRVSPWDGISLRGALHIVDRAGFSAVDFTVCNFRPTDDRYAAGMDPETEIRCFEFGNRPGHFAQVKAWKQGGRRVVLADHAGHQATFAGRRVFPYKLILKHYPLRNPEQSRRKVFVERMGRFAPHLRARGWNTQYDMCTLADPFIWDRTHLIEFDDRDTRRAYLTELIAGIGIVR